jgi:quercetin dioxygenase-like cupin family protein
MAKAGDVLDNPATGDHLTFLQTGAETNGEALEYELRFKPGGFAVRDHLHPHQSELHHVLEGELGIMVAGTEKRLGPGDEELVPVGTQHRIFAIGDEPIRARFELRPALESAVLLETLFGLANDGKVNEKGEPSVLQLAVIFNEFGKLGRPVKPPAAVQKAVFAPLAAIGRRKGLRARYPEYSGAA